MTKSVCFITWNVAIQMYELLERFKMNYTIIPVVVMLITFIGTVSSHVQLNRRHVKGTMIPWQNNTRCPSNVYSKNIKGPNEICAEVGIIIYECPDGVCCTPGSPASLCCPDDHPVCVHLGCCTTEYPKECPPTLCCEEDAICCQGADCCDTGEICCGIQCCDVGDICCGTNCCDAGNTCCGDNCCDSGQTCCGGNTCCETDETCCGNQCCKSFEQCCSDSSGKSTCCDKESMACCGNMGCSQPCPSQFDVSQCSNQYLSHNKYQSAYRVPTCPNANLTKILYRVLRPDESCSAGLKSKNPSAQESVLSFVNCGSKPGFASQFVSFTSSLDVAKSYSNQTKGAVIAAINLTAPILNSCQMFNLTDAKSRDQYLGNAVCTKFAIDSCEYLLRCNQTIPCQVLKFYDKDDQLLDFI